MSNRLARAEVLIQQDRYDMAETEIRGALAEAPDDGFAHALLAMALSGQDKHKEAIEASEEAVGLLPDVAFAHEIRGKVLLRNGDWKLAELSAKEAHQLDPEDADVCNLLAWITAHRANWKEMLRYADLGLEIDPEHIGCNNARAHALQMLGRGDEAQVALDTTLKNAPENATTHANQGWHLLRQGKAKESLTHFKEAMRLEPGHEYARAGLIEALKLRNPLYGPIFAYFNFLGRLSTNVQFALIIGAFLGYRVIRGMLADKPEYAPYLIAFIALYLLFILSTWAGPTLFNMTLWFHPLGRHALDRDQKMASQLCFAAIATALVCLGLAFLAPSILPSGLFWAAAFPFLCLPIAATFNLENPKKRNLGYVICAGFALVMFGGLVQSFMSGTVDPGGLWSVAVVGLAAFTWFGNLVLRD